MDGIRELGGRKEGMLGLQEKEGGREGGREGGNGGVTYRDAEVGGQDVVGCDEVPPVCAEEMEERMVRNTID